MSACIRHPRLHAPCLLVCPSLERPFQPARSVLACVPRSCPHAHLFPNIESSPSLCVPHRCLHLLWLPVRSILSGEPRSQGRPSLPEPRAHRPPSVRAPARRTLGGGGGPSWAAPRLPPRRPAAGAAPRAPPCPAGPGGAAHPAPLAEARRGGPRQAERRGSRMAAGQRRDTASSPLALALGLLAVAQVRGFAGPPPASPGRGSPAAQGRREVRTCGSRGRPGRAALPRWAPPRPAGSCRGCPQPLPARRAAGGLCRRLGVPSARSCEPGSSRQIPRREDGRVLVKVAMLLSFSECRE